MTNPFDPAYLAEASAEFGPLASLFFLLQVALLGAGAYARFVHQDKKTLRRLLVQRLGIALLALGGVGVVFAALRVGEVALFAPRYWFYLLLVVELSFASYVWYYVRTIYPAKVAESLQARGSGKGGARKASPRPAANSVSSPVKNSASTNENGEGSETASVVTSTRTRRDARRERKRKHR